MMRPTSDMFLEIKAQEANRAARRMEREQTSGFLEKQAQILRDRLSMLPADALVERSHLQSQLTNIEHRLRGLAVHRMPSDKDMDKEGGEEEQVGRFAFAVGEMLRTRPTRMAPVREILLDERVNQRWTNLQRSRIIQRSVTVKELLQKRCNMFEIFLDASFCEVICFAGERETANVYAGMVRQLNPSIMNTPVVGYAGAYPRLASQSQVPGQGPLPGMPVVGMSPTVGALTLPSMPSSASAMQALPSAMGPVLTSEQIAHVEMELAKNGGVERATKLCLQLDVHESLISAHFRLYDDGGKTMVTHMAPVLTALEELICDLSPRRSDILKAMQHCLEQAANHSEAIARLIVRSLQVPDLQNEEHIARFLLLSDVLYNSKSFYSKGAARYRSVFEPLLPDLCELLGREWIRQLRDAAEITRATTVVMKVLNAWRSWELFPDVFVGGLEALMLGPAPNGEPDREDHALIQKLVRWCSETDPQELPTAAKRRGLVGASISVEKSRERLCIYEHYWHQTNIERAAQAAVEKRLKKERKRAEAERKAKLAQAKAAEARLAAATQAAAQANADVFRKGDEDDLDGEPMDTREIEQRLRPRPDVDAELDGDSMSEGEWASEMASTNPG